MSKGTHRRQLRHTAKSLQSLDRDLDRLHELWDEMAPGMRAQSYDGAGGSSGHGDPTAMAVIDEKAASRAEADFGRHVEAAERAVRAAQTIADNWLVKIPAKAEELAKLELAADPGCEIVARVKRHRGPAYWEPEHVTSDVNGLLDRPYRLGGWAYEFVRKHGRLPNLAETRVHCEGRRVMVKAPAKATA